MYCGNCGGEVADASKFCQFCGSSLTVEATSPSVCANDAVEVQPIASPTSNSFAQSFDAVKEQVRFSQDLSRLYQEKRDAEECAAYWRLEHERLVSRSRTLRVMAIVIVMSGLGVIYSLYAQNPTLYSDPNRAVGAGVLFIGTLILFAFMPYGLAVVKDFVDERGYVVWFTWVFLVMAIGFVVVFAALAGIPSCLTLKSKIKKAEISEKEWHARALAIQRQIEAM